MSSLGSLCNDGMVKKARAAFSWKARARENRGNAMPVVKADRLTRIGAALLKAAGAAAEEADAVAMGCVNANLAGHDSHGIITVLTDPCEFDNLRSPPVGR